MNINVIETRYGTTWSFWPGNGQLAVCSVAELHCIIHQVAECAMGNNCPFCTLGPLYMDHLVSVRYDLYPVKEGHMLVTPNRHVASLLELQNAEYLQLFTVSLQMIKDYDTRLGREHDERSWNIGVNIGKNAGQTVPHVHVHLIPRTFKDVEDPRGGVRWVVSANAKYWD